MTKKDLEGKNAISNTELNVYKSEIENLREENLNFDKKMFYSRKRNNRINI